MGAFSFFECCLSIQGRCALLTARTELVRHSHSVIFSFHQLGVTMCSISFCSEIKVSGRAESFLQKA